MLYTAVTAFEKVCYLPFQPTSENLVAYFAKIIQEKLPKHIQLVKLILSETATSYAECNIEDFI